ncbi:MAG: Hpt domain-containing protein [Verrucomicrobiota bacterium]
MTEARIPIEPLAHLVSKLALELSFVEPGSDSGLLPINSFLLEIEERLQTTPMSPQVVQAVWQARQWLDHLFATTATFDPPTVAALAEWISWMTSALERKQNQLPPPALPASWNTAPAPANDRQIMPATTANDGKNAPPPGSPNEHDGESALILNLEADQELLLEFINESQEHLQNIEQGVLVLEDNPTDGDTLNSIFRAFHTFKGGSGFLNLTPIQVLAHELESLLDAARQHKLTINSATIDLILEGGDTLKRFLLQITERTQRNEAQPPIVVPTRGLIAKVQAVLASPAMAKVESSPRASPVSARMSPDGEQKANPPEHPAAGTKDEHTASAAMAFAKPASPQTVHSAAGFVKVDTIKLDSLIDLVGELVISESMVVQDPDLHGLPSRHLARNLAQLRRITSELQRTAMSLRMVPIRATFQKMTRLVRDLAARQHKQVQLVLSGEETELDRNIVEELSDPLIHMIRNAADHGIETPDGAHRPGQVRARHSSSPRFPSWRQHRHSNPGRRQWPGQRQAPCQGPRAGHRQAPAKH